jgi:hypothetical protein
MNNFIKTFKNKNRAPFWIIWLGWFVGGLCQIIDGLVNTLTFCFYNPNLTINWAFWIAQKQLKIKRETD